MDLCRDGQGVPAHVEQELHKFLECGVLANGFARFHCSTLLRPPFASERFEVHGRTSATG